MDLDAEDLSAFETRLGYLFRDRTLIGTAVTHRSLAHEQGRVENYERLEFLGDAVLGLVTAEWLYLRHPDDPEGELARLKSYLVSAPVLAHYAQVLGLGKLLLLGLGEERSGGRGKPSLLADSMEAVFGAVFLDGGLDAARAVVGGYLEQAMADRPPAVEHDAKTQLQELTQARGWELPDYRTVAESGPDHRKVFTVECWVRGSLVGSGQGLSKKLAEQRAASAALESLESS